MYDIYRVMNTIDAADLSANKVKMLYGIIVRLNRNFWKPVAIPASVTGRGMGKDTFLKERRALVEEGWISMIPGKWKTAPPVYDLGPGFKMDNKVKTEEVSMREDIRGKVTEQTKQAAAPSAWNSFDDFVEQWRLTYPKKASRQSIKNAIKDFVRGKDDWMAEQVKNLQDAINTHTAAYIASFDGNTRYMVSPVNYFASEKWREKLPVASSTKDLNFKSAGAHPVRNLPKVTVIEVNENQ